MITKHPWFGPKTFGWGWSPVSWEGWLASAICIAVIVAAYAIWGRSPVANYVTIGSVLALVVLCWVTGTPPGGSL